MGRYNKDLEKGNGCDEKDAKRPLLGKRIRSVNMKYSRRRTERSKHTNDTDMQGCSPLVLISTAVVAMGPIQFGFCCGYSSPTQAGMIEDLALTLSQFSLFGSLFNIGAMGGAALSGHVADCLGRKGALLTAVIPNILGWLLISLAKVPVYIAEIAPKHLPGGLGAVNQLSVTTGIMLAYLSGLFLPWRSLAFTGIIPSAILMVCIFFIPESPRWLAKVGKEDFQDSLQILRGHDSDVSTEAVEIKSALELSNERSAIKLHELCKRKYAFPLTIGIGLLLLQQLSGINGILFYSSFIFKASGISSANAASFALGSIQVVMTVWLTDKTGRRLLLMVSSGGMAACLFLVSLSFYMKGQLGVSTQYQTVFAMLALVSLLIHIAAFSLGLGAIPWIIMSKILPVGIKGFGGSVATALNWLASFGVTMTINLLLQWNASGNV